MQKMIPVAFVLSLTFAGGVHAETMMASHYSAPSPHIAAHRTLRFGTKLLITNPRNGRSRTVVIRDRGPFTKGRRLDISNEYARQLGFGDAGVLPLSVRILRK